MAIISIRNGGKGMETTKLGQAATMAIIAVLIMMGVLGTSGGVVVQAITTQYDPLKPDDFCRRHSHATAVIGDRLYIDGGYINTKFKDTTNYSMEHLLYLDLSDDVSKLPALDPPLSKPSTVPSVVGGQLWADAANGRLFMFGGEFPKDVDPSPVPRGIWMYDTWNDAWTLLEEDPSTKNYEMSRPSFGMGAAVEHEGRAYYLGGWIGERSMPGWKGPKIASGSMVIYDMVENTWRNESGPRPDLPRAEGVLLFVPAGDKGLLVSFGGMYTHRNGTVEPAPMSDIDIYDLNEGIWYKQEADGTVPETRRLFCAGVGTAQDGSSHNVYLYGGAAIEDNSNGYGDVYILSMPSFKWIKWWPTEENTQTNPHNSLSCNVVRGHQMIIMGGHFPGQDLCDVPRGFGVHNLDMGAYNKENTMWVGYTKEESAYLVPQAVVDVIGGDRNGKATKLAPDNGGFGQPALRTLFSRTFTPSPRAPTRTPRSKSNSSKSAAVIAPAVICPILLVCLLIGSFIIYRRKKQREAMLAQPIGGGGNPAYPYATGEYDGMGVDHVTAFQLPTTQSPSMRQSRFPPGTGPGGRPMTMLPHQTPFYQPGDAQSPGLYGQYHSQLYLQGHMGLAGLSSPQGPTQLATLPPQELPGELYTTPTKTDPDKKDKLAAIRVTAELSASGVDEALSAKIRAEERKIESLASPTAPAANTSMHIDSTPAPAQVPVHMPDEGNYILQQPAPISRSSSMHVPVISTAPPPRKAYSVRALPPLPTIPSTPKPTGTSVDGTTIPPPRRSQSHSRKLTGNVGIHTTKEEREMLASGPYYPPTPSTAAPESPSTVISMSMPTPTCETAGVARVVNGASPVAVVMSPSAGGRMSMYRLKRSGTNGRGVGEVHGQVPAGGTVMSPTEDPGERRRFSMEGELGVRYDSEGIRMV